MCYANCPHENYFGECKLAGKTSRYPPSAYCYNPPDEDVRNLNKDEDKETNMKLYLLEEKG